MEGDQGIEGQGDRWKKHNRAQSTSGFEQLFGFLRVCVC
jgi:hypothetical protein